MYNIIHRYILFEIRHLVELELVVRCPRHEVTPGHVTGQHLQKKGGFIKLKNKNACSDPRSIIDYVLFMIMYVKK